MKFILLVAIGLCSGLANAYCLEQTLTLPDQVSLDSDSVLIVTHASAKFDSRFASKKGLDIATSTAKTKGIPLLYLHDNPAEQDYFTADCGPEYWVFSENGELGFQVMASHVYVAGGHLEQCLFRTAQDVIDSWSMQDERDLTLTFVMDAIYSSGDLVRDSDGYYADFNSFIQVLSHGQEEEESLPKVTLLETMGIIKQNKRALEYLGRTLPNFESLMQQGYRVELVLNNSEPKALNDAPAWNSPTLRFRFVDSAARLNPL